SVGSVFAAPLGDDPTPTAAATATTPSSPSGAKQHAAHLISKFLQPIAQFFGLSRVDLLKQLAQGQTLAQIAASYGKTATDVQNAVMAALKTHLDARVAAGKLTAAQETQTLANAPTHISQALNKDLSKKAQRLLRRAAHQRAGQSPTASPTTTAQGQESSCPGIV